MYSEYSTYEYNVSIHINYTLKDIKNVLVHIIYFIWMFTYYPRNTLLYEYKLVFTESLISLRLFMTEFSHKQS